jgi:UDP-N-acetylglucosamine--N-acetylmuramyl-(pentapeptide) pyrophosphoryl-undecaprenol N-acetylglucosamine transferase
VGASRGLEATVVPREGFPLVTLALGGFARTGWMRRAQNAVLLVGALARAFGVVGRFRPDVVVGLGGYASFPVLAVAAVRGIPHVLMEQNVYPGLANRLLGRTAHAVAVPDARAAAYFGSRGVVTGNPVRPAFKGLPRREHRPPFTVLVTGGSQGAESINRAVIGALDLLREWKPRLRFVHQTGTRQEVGIREAYWKAGFEADVASFFESFEQYFARADLLVCRAGATTVAEIRAAGKASILVPLPYAADDHQRKNARAMVDQDAGVMIDPDDLSPERLANAIESLLGDIDRLERIETNARGLAVLDAEQRVAELIERAAGRREGEEPAAGQ